MTKGFLRYKFKAREGDHAVCFKCGKLFEKGDEIVRTRSNGYKYRHANCYLNADGEKRVPEISENLPR